MTRPDPLLDSSLVSESADGTTIADLMSCACAQRHLEQGARHLEQQIRRLAKVLPVAEFLELRDRLDGTIEAILLAGLR